MSLDILKRRLGLFILHHRMANRHIPPHEFLELLPVFQRIVRNLSTTTIIIIILVAPYTHTYRMEHVAEYLCVSSSPRQPHIFIKRRNHRVTHHIRLFRLVVAISFGCRVCVVQQSEVFSEQPTAQRVCEPPNHVLSSSKTEQPTE